MLCHQFLSRNKLHMSSMLCQVSTQWRIRIVYWGAWNSMPESCAVWLLGLFFVHPEYRSMGYGMERIRILNRLDILHNRKFVKIGIIFLIHYLALSIYWPFLCDTWFRSFAIYALLVGNTGHILEATVRRTATFLLKNIYFQL